METGRPVFKSVFQNRFFVVLEFPVFVIGCFFRKTGFSKNGFFAPTRMALSGAKGQPGGRVNHLNPSLQHTCGLLGEGFRLTSDAFLGVIPDQRVTFVGSAMVDDERTPTIIDIDLIGTTNDGAEPARR